MFRVVEFELEDKKQVFKRFYTKGYMLDSDGELFKHHAPQNTTDKRRKGYREVNLYTRRKDIKGKKVYALDIVKYKPEGLIGLIEWSPRRAAFVVYLRRDYFTVPYTLLDCQDRSMEVIGNLYQHPQLLDNKLKRR